MRLRLLTIVPSRHAVAPAGLVLPWATHHVIEVFMASLARGTEIDGSAKIQITCGPRNGEREYWQVLGVTEYYVEDFDLLGYAACPPGERRDQKTLELIERSLIEIAKRAGRDVPEIRAAAERVRQLEFRLSLEEKRLAQRTGGYVVSIFRSLSRDDGEVWSARVTDSKRNVLGEVLLTKRPQFLDLREAFFEGSVVDGSFVVKDRFGKVMAAADLAPLVGRI